MRDLLGRQFEELSIALRTDLEVEAGMEQHNIPPDVKRNVVLILKEAVSNALKHGAAKTITVRMHVGMTELTLQVEDDGKGFDTSNARAGGNVLINLRRRAEAIGSELTLESDGTGTRVAVRCGL
ncbi:MAG: ATP-binding protein [Flavobacteriales bacterium]|nr:ATP-binding protein [Flavobacteriales bacterium]